MIWGGTGTGGVGAEEKDEGDEVGDLGRDG